MPRRRDDELLQALGSRLRALRTSRGMTQEVLADQVRLKASTISEVERGHMAITVANWAALADALGVELPEMFAVGRGVPDPEIEPAEAELVRAWRALAEDRRGLALRLLAELGKR